MDTIYLDYSHPIEGVNISKNAGRVHSSKVSGVCVFWHSSVKQAIFCIVDPYCRLEFPIWIRSFLEFIPSRSNSLGRGRIREFDATEH